MKIEFFWGEIFVMAFVYLWFMFYYVSAFTDVALNRQSQRSLLIGRPGREVTVMSSPVGRVIGSVSLLVSVTLFFVK